MSSFVRVTPTARNAPSHVLLNAHHIHRLQEDSKGVTVILNGANAEHLHIAEPSRILVDAIKAEAKSGLITIHENVEKTPLHRTTFDLANIRAIEQTPSGGAVIRHGMDGSGIFEAYEDFNTVANLIDTAK